MRCMAALRRPRAKALHSGNPSDCYSEDDIAKASKRFMMTTLNGIDGWAYVEMAQFDLEDLQRYGNMMCSWRRQVVVLAQPFTNLMNMIPKKVVGAIRWVATMATGLRLATKLETRRDREWDANISPK